MTSKIQALLINNWRSGLTVALVSIPLSVALAVASQTSPIVGIITAIWAGFAATLFGSSNYNIIGPTGALSGILAAYSLTYGAYYLPMLALITGIFILIAWYARLERYLVFIPGSTIQGFTIGVALIIIFSQLHFILGLQALPKHKELLPRLMQIIHNSSNISFIAILIFTITFLILLMLSRRRFFIPGPIVIAPAALILGFLAHKQIIPIEVATIHTLYGTIQPKLFVMPHFAFDFSLLVTGALVALIALLETLISAKIADGITKTRHNTSQEIFGLGFANIITGIMGGMPATAALARTALNIRTGSNHKTSQAISSISIAVISLGFLSFFTYMPLPVIAAILVTVALGMIESEHIVQLFRYDKADFAVFLLVTLITLWQDPIFGILAGTALSLIIFAQKISHGYYELSMSGTEKTKDSDKVKYVIYSIKGPLAYINSQAHTARFYSPEFEKPKIVILRLRIYYIDIDGITALNEIIDHIEENGGLLMITEMKPHIQEIMKAQSKQYNRLLKKNLVFDTTDQALDYVASLPSI